MAVQSGTIWSASSVIDERYDNGENDADDDDSFISDFIIGKLLPFIKYGDNDDDDDCVVIIVSLLFIIGGGDDDGGVVVVVVVVVWLLW